jgi:hypothetical protein
MRLSTSFLLEISPCIGSSCFLRHFDVSFPRFAISTPPLKKVEEEEENELRVSVDALTSIAAPGGQLSQERSEELEPLSF